MMSRCRQKCSLPPSVSACAGPDRRRMRNMSDEIRHQRSLLSPCLNKLATEEQFRLAARCADTLLIASFTGDEQIAPEFRVAIPANSELLRTGRSNRSHLLQSERC